MIKSAPTRGLQGKTHSVKQRKNVTDLGLEAKGDKKCGFYNLMASIEKKKVVRKKRAQTHAFSFWGKWIWWDSQPATAEEIQANATLRCFRASQQRNEKPVTP